MQKPVHRKSGSSYLTVLWFVLCWGYVIALPAKGQAPEDSPLSACPGTPNCVHEVYEYPLLPSDLANNVEQALRALSPLSLERGIIDTHVMHAVYRAGFFKDDVEVAIVLHEHGSRLYIRSASRVGRSDLGVNKRRVKRILNKLDQLTKNNVH